jgi:hypothetical protein
MSWDNPIERAIIGPEFFKDLEEQMAIKYNKKVA